MPFMIECLSCHETVLTDDPTLWFPDSGIRHLAIDGDRILCASPMGIRGTVSTPLPCHPSETCVVWEHPEHGVRYPGHNDIDMPQRLKDWGFERREMRTLHEIERFEKRSGTVNEAAWYDKGSGRGYDD